MFTTRDYDGKADIWSVGCIYFEMLVGTCPFKGSNEVDLLNNINKKNLVIPSELEISSLSLDVLSKLLERVPDKRASVGQLMVLKSQLPRLSASSTASHGSPDEPSSRPRSASRHSVLEEEEDSATRLNPSSSAASLQQAQSPAAGSPILISQQARTPQMAFGSLNPSSATAATTLSMSPPGVSYRLQNPNVSPSSINTTAFYDSSYSQPVHSSQQKYHGSGSGKGGPSTDPSSSGRRHSTDSSLSPALANNNNNNTSAAAAIIGNIGKAFNFMMYSPSHRGPGNNNGANIAAVNPRSHITSNGKHSPQQGPTYDRRSISLDRANPPTFAVGQQTASVRTRQNSSAIPSYHQQPTSFYSEDPSSSSARQYTSSNHSYGAEAFDAFGIPLHSIATPNAIPSNRRETLQASAPDAEDDFVFIPSGSSAHSGDDRSSNSSQALLHQEQKVSDLQEHQNHYALNRQAQSSQLFQIDELSPPSTSLFLSNLTKRCHITCKIVHEITSLGDEYIQKVMNSEFVERNSISPKQPTAVVGRGGYIQRRSISGQTPAAMVDNYLIAISLYFHALNILKNLMGSITEGPTGVVGPRTSTEEVVAKIREVSDSSVLVALLLVLVPIVLDTVRFHEVISLIFYTGAFQSLQATDQSNGAVLFKYEANIFPRSRIFLSVGWERVYIADY